MPSHPSDARNFWREAFALYGAATPLVLPSVLIFAGIAAVVYLVQALNPHDLDISIEVGPHEIAGALLGLLLVMRNNSGYDRWWEARKLWGGLINQSRNLALTGLAYGPADAQWRRQFVSWIAAFAHAVRARLRGQAEIPELVALLGTDQAAKAQAVGHVPNYISLRLAELLQEARGKGMDSFSFLEAERQRAGLIDHLGGCERIRNTPLASVYSISTRRFIFLYLVSLPFALLHKLKAEWETPLVTALVAYAVLTLDQIGVELQEPFATTSLSHLLLDDYCSNLQRDLFALLEQAPSAVDVQRDGRKEGKP
jgi:putative membrane protein